MPCCAAINCSRKDTKAEREKGITFHKFPHKQPERLRDWLIKLRRQNYQPSARALLCSAHFEDSCFYRFGRHVQLREDAVPTKFDFPAHLQKVEKPARKEPRHRVNPSAEHLAESGLPGAPAAPEPGPSTADHSYHISAVSPRKLKRHLDELGDRNVELQKKLKLSYQKSRRLEKKVTDMSGVIDTLTEKGLVSNGCADVLQKFTGASRQLLERALNNDKGEYDSDLRAFALTLQFYSTKAYNFVRETFSMALPHPSVLRRWYSAMPGSPGFTQPAFSALQLRVQEAATKERKMLCALMLDEMAIRKHIQWDGKQFHGYVSVGSDDHDDSTPVAKDALVVMVVAVNDSWKVPCGYFFIDGMTGQERANLIVTCLERLHDIGVQVISLTCDGPSCHFSMLRALGASLNPMDMQPFFPHPSDLSKRVYVLLDSCHMLKLARNTLGDLKILADRDGNLILWNHIAALSDLQQEEGLHLANKLKPTHIQWHRQKMKVSLAAQTLSNSVADAIEFCSTTLQLRPFLASEGTVKFIRTFDKLFDVLNSRHPMGKGLKAPVRIENVQTWEPFLESAEEYILGLQDEHGQPMVHSRRKTAFIGFLACIRSVRGLFASFIACRDPPLKYLLTYKMSQDHLELFFCALRAHGRANNNPTAQQFTAAYKRLLMRHSIKASGGNCTQLDSTEILHALLHDPTAATQGSLPTRLSDVTIARKYELDLPELTEDDDNLVQSVRGIVDVPMSEYKSAVVAYIAGFVCRMAKKKISCKRCTSVLCSNDGQCHPFISLKDKGGLQKPSTDVIVICQRTDSCIRKILQMTNNKLPQGPGVPSAIASSVLSAVHNKVFLSLDDHDLDTAVEENHVFILIKTVALCYITILFHHLGKKETNAVNGAKIRKQISKLILFKHQ